MPATCEPFREALSAMADGELMPVGEAALADHLDHCPSCTAFAAASDDLSRRVRVGPAEALPDLTAEILAAVQTPDLARSRTRFGQVRVLLALVGVTQLLLAVPTLTGAGTGAAHLTREVGIFEVALGIGFLVVAHRPARASGLLPVAAVVAMLATVTSLGDVVAGSTTLAQETAHLLQVLGTVAVWALHRGRGRASLQPATP